MNLVRSPQVLVTRRGRWGAYADQAVDGAAAELARLGRLAGLTTRHELSLLLCDNPVMQRLNRDWRGKDTPTDVLSFPLYELRPGEPPPAGPLGDIVVSIPVVRYAAMEYNIPIDRHLRRLLAHGLLHLLGYDHETEAQHRQMTAAEERLLAGKRNA